MINKKTKIKYDSESDVMSLELLNKGQIDFASELGNFIVHFTKNNIPVLIEILEASKFLKQSNKVLNVSPINRFSYAR